MDNPFEITKAVDFSDQQIERTYISFGGGPHSIIDPSTPMPQFLTGLKGGGRTHLMRHFSYQLQRGRNSEPLSQVADDGYLGVYFRCSGLNGSRFEGKGQEPDAWSALFAYYLDLWIVELLLGMILEMSDEHEWTDEAQLPVLEAVAHALGRGGQADVAANSMPLTTAQERITSLRSEIDWAVNNAAITRELRVEIRSNPGSLIFDVCRAVVKLPGLQSVMITFLVDEYENLSTTQQEYFNTLMREKEPPATFIVGARRWGIRSHRTLSGGEVNKQGSEYELTIIEDVYAKDPAAYEEFCRRMVAIRLRDSGLLEEEATAWFARLDGGPDNKLLDRQLHEVLEKFAPEERPHLIRLRASLAKVRVESDQADAISKALAFPDHPLIEKLALLRFYQDWAANGPPDVDGARGIAASLRPLIVGGATPELENFLRQRKSDAVAQIYRDANRGLVYAGFDEFLSMSGFLPRSLLMLLKYVSRWATFFGQDAVRGSEPISGRALSAGVMEAARWYFGDAKPLGAKGEECEVAIRRLGLYLQSIRLSDKPSEIDVTTFSSGLIGASDRSLEVLTRCIDHGLLIEVPGGRASRNFGSTHRKFQLHPMLTPLWSLTPGRRGDVTLTTEVFESVFSPDVDETAYQRSREERIQTLNAPFNRAIDTREPLF